MHLLLVFILSIVSYTAQPPCAAFRSTSTALPTTPTQVCGSMQRNYTIPVAATDIQPYQAPWDKGPKRAIIDEEGDDWTRPDDEKDPMLPIGEPMVLLLMAALYCIGRVCKRRFKKI